MISPRYTGAAMVATGVIVMTFGVGAISGAETAQNETVGYAEVENATQQLQDVPQETADEVRSNTTAWLAPVVNGVARPVTQLAVTSSIWAMEFGYNQPHAGRVGGSLSLILGGLLSIGGPVVELLKLKRAVIGQ